jgi:hypothetical protein
MADRNERDGSVGDRPWNDADWIQDDNELLYITLEIDDPRALPNRVERIPDGVTAVRLEQAYKCSERLPCANPGCSARHYKGYIARLSNEQVANIGHICGAQLFPGEGNWEQQRATLDWKINRQDYLRRIAPLARNIISALSILKSWERPFNSWRNQRDFIQDFCYSFYKELENVARAEGVLKVSRRSKHIEMGGARDYWDTIGRLQGAEIFLKPSPFEMLRDVRSQLLQIKRSAFQVPRHGCLHKGRPLKATDSLCSREQAYLASSSGAQGAGLH